jgi:hypothetical protein
MSQQMIMPNSTLTFVLHLLIEKGNVSERDTKLNGYRTRISEIENKHGIKLKEKIVKFTNDFGRKGWYKEHSIEPGYKEKAKTVLKELVSK